MALSGRLLLVLNIRQRCWTLQHSFRKTFQAQTFQLLKNQHAAKNAIKYGVVVGASSLGAYWSMRVAQSFSVTTVMAESLAPTAAATVEPDAVMSAIIKHKSKPRQQENALSFVRLVIDKLALFLRFTRLSLTFGPLLFLYPFTLINHQLYKLWLKGLFLAMESAGPVFIKLGQWASTRRDLFSKEFCDKFSTLHRKVRPHDWKHTKNALNAAFGKSSKWWKVLKIDEKLPPLGSGCVAQVYKGYVHTSVVEQEVIDALEENETDFDDLCYQDGVPVELPSHDRDEQSADDSQQDSPAELEGSLADYAENPDYIPVAVKVLHPQIRKQFSRDLALMKVMARIMETVIPSLRWVNLIQCVEEFSKTMVKQMDMIHESKCLKRFHRDFANSNCVKVPVPIKSLLARNVLVESFEEGQPISDFLTESADIPRGLKHKLADMGVDALLQMVCVRLY